MFLYPNDLYDQLIHEYSKVKNQKFNALPDVPEKDLFQIFVDTAFHASFLTEEGRRIGFRIMYIPDEIAFKNKQNNIIFQNRIRFIPFEKKRIYSVSEVNKISPVVEYKRYILCVSPNKTRKKELFIIGLLDVGDNWWKFVHHETSGGTPPPNNYTVTCLKPGELSISSNGRIILVLRNGQIEKPSNNALWEGPINDFLKIAREEFYKEVLKSINKKTYGKEDHDYPYFFYNTFLERLLFSIREKMHGGTIIILPYDINKNDTRLTDRINIKYSCNYNYAWDTLISYLKTHWEYYDLHFSLWDNKQTITTEKFQKHSILNSHLEEISDSISDLVNAIASMSSIDGAVVLNDHFEVIGFGAEVLAVSPSLVNVKVYAKNGRMKSIPIESYGTRHRSAFRFCSSFDNAIAFIVSQDGAVKAVKRVGSDVIIWTDINNGSLGI